MTKDEDLQEQLYKLQHTLDTQYRSMLLADRFLADQDSLVTFPMPTDVKELAEVFHVNDGVMIERTDNLAEEILPSTAKLIPVHCWVIGKTFSQMTFMAETGMQALLSVKGKTAGLNTARLEGKNCHFWLAPLRIPEKLRKCAVIATDVRMPFGIKDVPYLDFLQMINCMERFKRVVEDC